MNDAGMICSCPRQVLREIFLTLVGRQGDRDASSVGVPPQGGARNQPSGEVATVLKGLRADCR